MSFTTPFTSLDKISLSELEQEIERRQKIHKFKIDDVEFELTLEQIKKLQAELEKICPINDVMDIWKKYSERTKDITPRRPPNPYPPYYDYDKLTYPGMPNPFKSPNDIPNGPYCNNTEGEWIDTYSR